MNRPPLSPGLQYLDHLGRGGTAEVIRVYVTDWQREAAFKYPLDNNPETVSLFAHLAHRENILVGSLRFPGLVRILGHSDGRQPYLLLELCQGPTLDQTGRIDDVPLSLNLISALALNLQYLQQHCLIHGDLKPQNVFLPSTWSDTTDDNLFYLKLSDFSLGRRADEALEARAGLGTVGYMAPEVIADSICDHRSDLFALGVTAYFLLAGRHPFIEGDDADPVRINSRVNEANAAPLADFRKDMNPAVWEIVAALLEKSPQNRPADGWEVCQRLRDIGATYPFERALQPKHLVSPQDSYLDNIRAALNLDPRQGRRLDLLTDSDSKQLRAILTANFLKGNLVFDQGRFVFTRDIYWPSRSRRETLSVFGDASFRERRWMIQSAITGRPSPDAALELFGSNEAPAGSGALTDLIRPLLKPSTVRALSARTAPRAEKREWLELAARLYMQAGDLVASERCAYQAAVTLNKNHDNETALNLLSSVISYAEMIGRIFDVRQLLMVQGDILKETGATEAAMVTYNVIIEQYHDRPADKLLAETYKDLGDLYKMMQDHLAGLAALETAQRIYSELGDELELSHTLNNLGNIHWVGSNYPAALKSYRRALKIQRRLGSMGDVASTLSNIGSIFAVVGNLQRTVRLFRQSIEICREDGNQLEEARILNNLGYAHHLRGELSEAVECLERSLVINRRLGTQKEILFNLENLTAITASTGQLKRSIQYLTEGMALAVELDDRPHLAAFKAGMAKTLKRLGRFSEAEALYREAAVAYDEVEDHLGRAQLEISLADLRRRIGDSDDAMRIAVATMQRRAAVKEKTTELEALLVITRISDDSQYLQRARALAVELKLEREKLLIDFNALGRTLRCEDQVANPDQYVDILVDLDNMPDEIETPSLCNLAGELMINLGRYEAAERYLQRSQKVAAASGLLPETVDVYTQFGRMHAELGDFEQAYSYFREALDAAKKIAGDIDNPQDRKRYQNRRTIVYLVFEIKRLAQALAQKKRQVPETPASSL